MTRTHLQENEKYERDQRKNMKYQRKIVVFLFAFDRCDWTLRLNISIRDCVPIATQFFAINEKWVLVKFMKALGTFCV